MSLFYCYLYFDSSCSFIKEIFSELKIKVACYMLNDKVIAKSKAFLSHLCGGEQQLQDFEN
jgi:hypothetical protein